MEKWSMLHYVTQAWNVTVYAASNESFVRGEDSLPRNLNWAREKNYTYSFSSLLSHSPPYASQLALTHIRRTYIHYITYLTSNPHFPPNRTTTKTHTPAKNPKLKVCVPTLLSQDRVNLWLKKKEETHKRNGNASMYVCA